MKVFPFWAFGLWMLLSGYAWPEPVAPDDRPVTTTVSGEAALIDNNLPQARQQALLEAFGAAVAQLLGSYISAESYTRNYESLERGVYSKTRGYVKSYQVLKEDVSDQILTVTVQVTVSTQTVLDDLTTLGILMNKMGNPVLSIQGEDEGLTDPQSVQFFKRAFAEKSFEVVQNDPARSDIVVRLTGRIGHQSAIGNLRGAIVTVDASAQWRPSDRLIGTGSQTGNGAGPNDEDALKTAYARASEALFADFLRSVLTRWQDEANNGRPVAVTVDNIDYGQARLLRGRFSHLIGVKKATLKGFEGGRAIYILDFNAGTDLLADLLQRVNYPTISLRVHRLEGDHIVLQASRNQ